MSDRKFADVPFPDGDGYEDKWNDGDPAKLPVCVPEAGTFSLVPLVRLEQLCGGAEVAEDERCRAVFFFSSPELPSDGKEGRQGDVAEQPGECVEEEEGREGH